MDARGCSLACVVRFMFLVLVTHVTIWEENSRSVVSCGASSVL